MTGKHADVLRQPRREKVPSRPRAPAGVPTVVGAGGGGGAGLGGRGGPPGGGGGRGAGGGGVAVRAGRDGSPAGGGAGVLAVVAVTARAVWFTRRAGRAGRGATALLLGIAGTAAGAGIGGAHLARAGLDAAAVLAVIVLATGLILVSWGAAALVRAIPGWWRLLAVPLALALLEFVLLPLTMAAYATNLPPGPLGTGTPARYGLACQDVSFRTADGVRLSAWYLPSRNSAAVVLLPGSGSTRTAVLSQAAVLARHGYGALLVDTRG